MELVKIVGLSAICANGLSKEEVFNSVSTLNSSIDETGMSALNKEQWETLACSIPEPFRKSRSNILSYSNLNSVLHESGWTKEQIAESGFIFASTTSQIDLWEKTLPFYNQNNESSTNNNININMSPNNSTHLCTNISNTTTANINNDRIIDSSTSLTSVSDSVANQSLGTPVLNLSQFFGIGGPISLLTSSCSASLQALALAFMWIRSKKVKRCIVGATEINADLTQIGFNSLRLISKHKCSPFSQNRLGINLGEGSAFICLEAENRTNIATQPCWGYISGIGLSTDAYHPTAPHPEGLGSQRAMQMALNSACLQAKNIDWIYAHGTGSPANDLAEAKAIAKVFTNQPYVTSTKASHAHTLAASGALESVLGLMALKQNIILPTLNHQTLDPALSLKVSTEKKIQPVSHFLKNSLGFGGINASVIFSKNGVFS